MTDATHGKKEKNDCTGLPSQNDSDFKISNAIGVMVGQPWGDAEVIAVDQESGLAVLATGLTRQRVQARFENSVKVGQAIRAIWAEPGYGKDRDGVIVKTRQEVVDPKSKASRMAILHDISAPGSAAGGPIVNRQGRIVGILSWTGPAAVPVSGGAGLAVPIADVMKLVHSAVTKIGPKADRAEGGSQQWLQQMVTGMQDRDEASLQLLEIQRQVIDAKHAAIAADRKLTRLRTLSERADGIISEDELERAGLEFNRARDLLNATQKIYDARMKLLQQRIEQTDAEIKAQTEAFRAAGEGAQARAIRAEIFLLEALRQQLQTIHDSLQEKPVEESDSAGARIPPGMAVVAIAVDKATTSNILLQPGDRVDVYVTLNTRGEAGVARQIKTVLEFVEVFSIDQKIEIEVTKSDLRTNTVALLLAIDQARLVKIAEDTGKLHITLRSKDDSARRAKDSELFTPKFVNSGDGSDGEEKVKGNGTSVIDARKPDEGSGDFGTEESEKAAE